MTKALTGKYEIRSNEIWLITEEHEICIMKFGDALDAEDFLRCFRHSHPATYFEHES